MKTAQAHSLTLRSGLDLLTFVHTLELLYTGKMKSISEFHSPLRFVLTDIDDTLTDHGQLGVEAYHALWNLSAQSFQVIPVTGRPAGWCEMIARFWPVAGVIGENGGFYFRYKDKTMKRHFHFDEKTQNENRKKLDTLQQKILRDVPGSALASDQFCRLMDLAIDFCEDVPALPRSQVEKIVEMFHSEGAQAKVSSIHVNGWFGNYDKKTMALKFLENEFSVSAAEARKVCAFVGDSLNDEPLFECFPHSFGVANVKEFLPQMKSPPSYIANSRGGKGFSEIAQQILKNSIQTKNP